MWLTELYQKSESLRLIGFFATNKKSSLSRCGAVAAFSKDRVNIFGIYSDMKGFYMVCSTFAS